jgi:hypothetical protein
LDGLHFDVWGNVEDVATVRELLFLLRELPANSTPIGRSVGSFDPVLRLPDDEK